MSKVNLPKTNQTGKNEWADVEDNDVALREGINSIESLNLSETDKRRIYFGNAMKLLRME